MTTGDTSRSIGQTLDPLHVFNFWGAGGETTEERNARLLREKAAQQAQDQLDFSKAVYQENKGTMNDLGRDLFGRTSPEDMQAAAQEYANQRAQSAAGLVGSNPVTTPSGKQGTYDFGQPTPASAASAASSAPPSPQSLGFIYNPKSGMWTDSKGKPATAAQISQAQSAAAGSAGSAPAASAAPAAPANAAVTDADRAQAAAAAAASYKNTLPGQLAGATAQRGSAVDQLINELNGIKSVDAGNYDNAWNVDANKQYISPEARQAQQQAMNKTFALTDTKETAEEKLMREMSRRTQEQNLRAQSEAQANQLRARGAYGSGAELAGFLGNQQEQAQRRSLDEMGANANAQKREIDALGQYGNQAFALGQQDINQGSLQDLNSRFNSQSQQNFQQFKTKTQQQENEAQARRDATKADASIGQSDAQKNDAKYIADTKIRLAGGKTGTNLSSAAPVNEASQNLGQNFQQQASQQDAKDAFKNDWSIL